MGLCLLLCFPLIGDDSVLELALDFHPDEIKMDQGFIDDELIIKPVLHWIRSLAIMSTFRIVPNVRMFC